MRWFFGFFFVSGLCSVLYELVWLRIAMANFGVTSALTALVLSTFMAGLGLGSWASGELLRVHGERLRWPALRLYALAELLIGLSAIVVPYELAWGRALVAHVGPSSSLGYYLASGTWIAVTLLPWCACMGATIPIGMLAIRALFPSESQRSFSFLYLSNVLGAVVGTTLPLLLVELLGFRSTLYVGASWNVALAVSAWILSDRTGTPAASSRPGLHETVAAASAVRNPMLIPLLFLTGLTSMGMEVVWIRQYTPYLGTVVYAFASILAVYLVATYAGSQVYRRWSRGGGEERKFLWALLAVTALFPVMAASPSLDIPVAVRLAAGIAPFAGLLGFLTPMVVDRWCAGEPAKAGRGYAVNVIGCILGPLLSGFVLLPVMSERWALFALAAPWLVLAVWPRWSSARERSTRAFRLTMPGYAMLAAIPLLLLAGTDYEQQFPGPVMRDSTATIIATGTGLDKALVVNGVGITILTPITKMMAHLPAAHLDRAPSNALVICFGMGTTFRSFMSWGIHVTAVELVPSVPRVFQYFHDDGSDLLRSPRATMVIDDGRRFLERTPQRYDLIVIDPPPPVGAAGSSLLYSKEFYTVVARRLEDGGIVQQWLPGGDPVTRAAITRALVESFPYVRAFASLEGWGVHFLASNHALPVRTASQLAARLPARAVADLLEWGPAHEATRQFAEVVDHELAIDTISAAADRAPALSDDRPVNEYDLLRRRLPDSWGPWVWQEPEPRRQ